MKKRKRINKILILIIVLFLVNSCSENAKQVTDDIKVVKFTFNCDCLNNLKKAQITKLSEKNSSLKFRDSIEVLNDTLFYFINHNYSYFDYHYDYNLSILVEKDTLLYQIADIEVAYEHLPSQTVRNKIIGYKINGQYYNSRFINVKCDD